MKRGQRLTNEGKTIARKNVITDGPFGESKEVIGGYWFILANNLDEAAQIAKGNPCLDCGMFFEIRPIDPQRGNPRQYPPVMTTNNAWRDYCPRDLPRAVFETNGFRLEAAGVKSLTAGAEMLCSTRKRPSSIRR